MAANNDIDLDYDDDLERDAEQLAQGVSSTSMPQSVVKDKGKAAAAAVCVEKTLEQVLSVAKEVYGETNSEHSEMFCHWVDDVLKGTTNVRETKELLVLLYENKQYFTGCAGWNRSTGRPERAVQLEARRNASICAMNVTRAVLNKLKGLEYGAWLERALWRASRTEMDIKDKG